MNDTLFIPTKLKVGYQNRQDTFTGKLAYVIYYDEKGKLRKEKSWTGWCDSNIPSDEFENKPTTGFVIHKGQQRFAEWFGTGRTMIRIHHPDGFEFEITVNNLMNILMHSDVSKRDIVQECVFAWGGTELVLLPTNSQEYQASIVHTDKQSLQVSAKDLVPGRTYTRKKSSDTLLYVGFYEFFDTSTKYEYRTGKTAQHMDCKGKKHVFYDSSCKNFSAPSPSVLAHEVSEDISPELANVIESFYKTLHCCPSKDPQLLNPLTLDVFTSRLAEARRLNTIGKYHNYQKVRAYRQLENGTIHYVELVISLAGEKYYDQKQRINVDIDMDPNHMIFNKDYWNCGEIKPVEAPTKSKRWELLSGKLWGSHYYMESHEILKKHFTTLLNKLDALPRQPDRHIPSRAFMKIVSLQDIFNVLTDDGFTFGGISLENESGLKLDIIREY